LELLISRKTNNQSQTFQKYTIYYLIKKKQYIGNVKVSIDLMFLFYFYNNIDLMVAILKGEIEIYLKENNMFFLKGFRNIFTNRTIVQVIPL